MRDYVIAVSVVFLCTVAFGGLDALGALAGVQSKTPPRCFPIPPMCSGESRPVCICQDIYDTHCVWMCSR